MTNQKILYFYLLIQNIIGAFINGAVSAYMTEVKKKSISGSLTKQNIKISQLEIFPDALLQHGIPFLIKKGTIKNVSIQMPTKFKTDPVTITIDSVTILCSICTHDPIPEEIINMKFHKLKAYQLFRKRYKMILGLLHKESFFSVVRTITSNLIMEINHIHVQIECSSKSKYDLTIPSFLFQEPLTKSSNSKPIQISDDVLYNDEKQDSSIDLSENSLNECSADDCADESQADESSESINEETLSFQRFSSCQTYLTGSSDNEKNYSQQSQDEKVTSIGITISKLSLRNSGSSKETTSKKFTKDVYFSNFGIYMDIGEQPVDLSTNEKCEAELHNLFNSQKHNWILQPFSFHALLKFEKDNPQLSFEPVIQAILVNLKEEYIPVILNLLETVDTFQKKFSVAHIPKPSFENPKDMWTYCHKCAVTKISNATFDFSKSLNLLVKRFIYLKNYKKKNTKSRNIIKNLEETLNYATIVAFRSAYRLIHKKRKSKKKSKITAKTTHKIIKEIRIDPVHFVTKLLEMFSLNFSGDLLKVILTQNDDQKHIDIEIKKPNLVIEKDLKSVLIHANISYICIKRKETVIFQSLDDNQVKLKTDLKIPFHSYSNWYISLDMSNNNYTINMKSLLQTITDVSIMKLFSLEKKYQILSRRKCEYNIQFFSSVLKIIGSSHNHVIQIDLNKFFLSTDPKSFEKKFKFAKSIISFINGNEIKPISSDFYFTGSLMRKNLDISVPLFTCSIPLKYYVVIEDFTRLFMKYQMILKNSVFSKIDVDFDINIKGLDVIISQLNSNKSQTIQIRQISIAFKKSVFNFSMLSVAIKNLFSLNNLTVFNEEFSSNLKIQSIKVKLMELISLLPKNLLKKQPTITAKSNDKFKADFSADSVSETTTTTTTSTTTCKSGRNIKLPKIKVGFVVDNLDIDFSITNSEQINMNVKNIIALFNNDKLNISALLDKILYDDQLILSEPISFQMNVFIGQIIEIAMNIDNINFDMKKELVNYFLNLDFPVNKIELRNDIQLKMSLKLNLITISNEIMIKNLSFDFNLTFSMINSILKFDTIKSNFLEIAPNTIIQTNYDIDNKSIDLNVNLGEIKIFTISFIEFILNFQISTPKIPQIKLSLIIEKPLRLNLCFGEDYLNIIFNSNIKFKFDGTQKQIPSFYLKITDFYINLNNNEMLIMKYLKFTMDKNIIISIPSIIIKLTMFKVYKIIKMLPSSSQISNLMYYQPKILIYQIPVETISLQIPLIEIKIFKTNSRRCISLTFDNTEAYLKNYNSKSELYAITKILFEASNGFLSYRLALPFSIECNGEFSETVNNCVFKAKNPIKFEISSYLINQILKNLTIKEDEIEQEYSISNETGTNVTIIINDEVHELESKGILPSVPNFVGSDINLKIGDISNPIKVYSSFSKIAFPLFFKNHFILLWMDVKRLQLRLLSPISFINKSKVDLRIKFLDREITLKNKEKHDLDYTIDRLDFITVKFDEDEQRIQLNESCAIKLSNKFIVVTKKRKIETLKTTIKFRAPYYFRNELNSDLTITLKEVNQNVLLNPCTIVPFPFFPPSSSTISFDILDSKDIKGLHVDLHFNEEQENRIIIPTVDQEGNPFSLQFTLYNKKYNVISISPLLIFYSSLSIPLIFNVSSNDEIKKERIVDMSKIFPIKNSQDIWDINNPIMVSPLIKDIKNIKVFISTKFSNHWPSNPFTMSDFDIIEDLLIPIDDEILSFAHFHILTHNDFRPNTFIFFISPKYFITNQTDQTFSLNFFDGESIEISPNSTIPVTIIRKSLKFSISIITEKLMIDKQQKKKLNLIYSHKINIEKVTSQFVKLHSIESPFLLQLSTKKEINFITILQNQTLPYLFVNNTDSKVIFVQKDTPDFAHVVMPKESLPFFIYDENMPTIIFCSINNQIKFELDVNEPSFPVKIETAQNDTLNNHMNLYYYVDLSKKEGSTITLCNIIDNEMSIKSDSTPNSSINYRIFMGLISRNDESSTNFNVKSDVLNLSFKFEYVSFLIITSQYQEMCRLTLKDIMINSSIYDFSTETQISVGLIKVDDQNQYAIYPSVFQILPIGNKPAIRFSFNSFGSHKYGKIEFDIRPIIVRIDLSFISDFIFDIFYFHNNYKKNKAKLKMNDVQITEIIHNLMPKQTKYHINRISINTFDVHFSFHKISARSNHQFQKKFHFNRLINFIPSFDHIAISIENSHFFRNLSGTTDEIVFKISHEIKKLILKRLYHKINILGSRKMNENENEGVIQKFSLFDKVYSIFSITENSFLYLSSVMDLYTGSPPNIRTDETSIGALKWGVLSFFSSIKNGSKQLFVEMKKRGKINDKNDYCGFIVGFGIGISKCAAYFVSGFCNLNASLYSSAKRIFFSDKFIFIDERECEPSLGLHCSDNERLLWFTGSVSSGLIEVYSQSIFILDENLFIQNIVRAEVVENTVYIYDENQNKFVSRFENENQANLFLNIIESQLLRKKIVSSDTNNDKIIEDLS